MDISPPTSESDTASLTSGLRGDKLRTFVVSVPINGKVPKIKKGHIKELGKADTLQDIGNHVDEAESIVQNIQIITVECSKCVGSFNKIFSKCKVKATVV